MSKLYHPAPTHPYFLYEPASGMEFFDNVEERDKAAADCIAEYLDGDGWGEEVDGIFVGTVTGRSQKFNVRERPDELDEDGCDHEGINWSNTDFTELCDYRIEPVADPKDAEIERLREALGIAVRQNEHDMLMTGDELRLCRAALAEQGGCLTVVEMRVKMNDASRRMEKLFELVKSAQAPSLVELTERLKNVPEVSGTVRQPKVDTPESKEAP